MPCGDDYFDVMVIFGAIEHDAYGPDATQRETAGARGPEGYSMFYTAMHELSSLE
jgi:hypothetical protein